MSVAENLMSSASIRLEYLAAYTAAVVFAALAAAFVMVFGIVPLVPLAFAVTLPHSLLALLLFVTLRACSERWINGISAILSGLFIGAISTSFLLWPECYKCSSSVRDVPLIIDGAVTAAGWSRYGLMVLWMGFAGASGGFAFWLALLCCGFSRAQAVASGEPKYSVRRFLIFTAAASGVIFTLWVIAVGGLWPLTLLLGHL